MATYRAARVGVNVDPASAPRLRNRESSEASESCLFLSRAKESRAVHASDAFRRKSSARHRPHAMATRVFRDGDELVSRSSVLFVFETFASVFSKKKRTPTCA